VRTVIFDLGGVLIDWDPRYLYRKLMPGREAEMEAFLSEVCNQGWNHQQDAGRSLAEATEALLAEHVHLIARQPEMRDLIEAYYGRWGEMLGGPIEGTLAILAELRASGVPLYALTNWSGETFPIALERYEFLGWFDGIAVSGELGVCKPDPRIYRYLIERHDLDPEEVLFIDDHEANVEAARDLGMTALRFQDPARLRAELAAVGLLA
jgi:2-haloacid dehalogenase